MWYVIHTMSGMEQKCMAQCKCYVAGADCKDVFVPQYIAKRHYKKEWHDVTRTLFPGYVFVDTENIDAVMKELHKVRQYTRVLRNCEAVSPITDGEQDFLEKMMDGERVVRYSEGFMVGNEAVVTSGPLKNFRGRIRSVDRHRRIAKLELPVFGDSTPVEVGFGAIARVSEEEFEKAVRENAGRNALTGPGSGAVRVVDGIFKGMTGKMIGQGDGPDECMVGMELFGARVEVSFRRNEIEILR